MGRPKPPKLPGREARRWDDPDSDDDDDDGQEEFQSQTDHQGLNNGEDDDSEEDFKGSDSEGEKGADETLTKLGGLEAFTRKRPAKEKRKEEVLWDPLADLGPRKKQKGAGNASVPVGSAPVTTARGPPAGAVVILQGLAKAPHLNGKTGTVAAAVDAATGRCQVLLPDNSVKSLKLENLREVLTGAVVRLKGLQAAPELNGALAECGELELSSQRYSVILADGKETVKKVKETNLEIVGRYLQPKKYLAAVEKAFNWKTVLQQGKDLEHQSWSSRLKLFVQCGLPVPRFVAGSQLVDPKSMISPATTAAEQLPVTDSGRLACRLLAVSTERDHCIPSAKTEEMRRIRALAEALQKRDAETATYFLIPGYCTEALSCLKSSASLAWPLYLQLCQAVVCLETPHHSHKAWSRLEELVASQVLSQPVYLLGGGSLALKNKAPAESEGSWLLSDRAEELKIGAPSDGQALPNERSLLEVMSSSLPGGWRKGANITCYRL